MVSYQSRFLAITLFASSPAPAATTVFDNDMGNGDLDIGEADNWDSGLPTLTDVGCVGGSFSTTYDRNGAADLNARQIIFEGTASLNGGGAQLTDSIIILTEDSAWTADGTTRLGRNAGTEANMSVLIQDDATWTIGSGGNLQVGRNQVAIVNQSGGTVNVGNNVVVGSADGGSGSSYTISGGLLDVERDIQVKRSSTLTISETDPINAPTTVDIVRNLDLEGTGSQITISGGEVIVGQNISVSSDNINITQTGGTVKVTNNIQLNNGSGREYRLQGGRLEVASRIIVGSNNVFVWESGGVLAVATGETFIDYRGDLTAGSGAELDLANNTQYLDVGGELIVNGLTINGYDLMLALQQEPEGGNRVEGSYLLIETNTFDTADIDNITPIFTDSIGELIDRTQVGSINPTDTVFWIDNDGNDIRLYYSIAPVPEPSTALIAMMGAGLLAMRRRR